MKLKIVLQTFRNCCVLFANMFFICILHVYTNFFSKIKKYETVKCYSFENLDRLIVLNVLKSIVF